MKITEFDYLSKLYDVYGGLLSFSQQEAMRDFFDYGLTGSEIAENKKVSRQAIKDCLKKAQAKLKKYELTLRLVEKIESLEGEIEELRKKIKE